jgi:hypothetical protein
MDRLISDDMPGLLVSVYSKEHGIDWNGVSGVKSKDKKEPLRPEHTFRIASVTKTFVAATILRLWEQGKLDLDDSISKYISEEHDEILKEGGHTPSNITIAQLLTHSAGLADHTHTPRYSPEVLKSNYVWTRTEQLQTLAEFTKPIGKPGEKYAYSDTGYIRKAAKRISKRLGFDGCFTYYSARYSSATLALNEGVDRNTVSHLLDHENFSTIDNYAGRANDENMVKAMEVLRLRNKSTQ